MNRFFENQVALVTGAGSGIGLATAKAFAASGASVALADWNEKAVRSAAEEQSARVHRCRYSWLPHAVITNDFHAFSHG
jgi:NAD(P)-dependent dehydrogenase (short-subunit alcohol dehydrogenase family)